MKSMEEKEKNEELQEAMQEMLRQLEREDEEVMARHEELTGKLPPRSKEIDELMK